MRIIVIMGGLNVCFLYLSYETDLISIGVRYKNKWYREDYVRFTSNSTNRPALFNFGDEE